MKNFDIGDVLSVTTGRLVSPRGGEGVYDILNFLTGDNLVTHQLPRAMKECKPWLRTQFPQLFTENPDMARLVVELKETIQVLDPEHGGDVVTAAWVNAVAQQFGLPEQLPVYEMDAEMHTRIDPVEELRAMVGDDRIHTVLMPPKNG